MVVLNENKWAKEMIESKSIGDDLFETLCRVSRYYIDCGYDKKTVRNKVDAFLRTSDLSISIPKFERLVEAAIKRSYKREAIAIDCIPIYKEELNIINSIKGKPIKRLAFTLLCLAKYWDIANSRQDHWVNTKDTEIKKMANIRTSISRESEMYRRLKNMGLIEFSKKVDSLNVRVLFIKDKSDDVEINITDFRNLGNQYLMHIGEPYYKCQNCGLVTKLDYSGKGSRPKYCKECAIKLDIQSRINAVMRHRIRKAKQL